MRVQYLRYFYGLCVWADVFVCVYIHVHAKSMCLWGLLDFLTTMEMEVFLNMARRIV